MKKTKSGTEAVVRAMLKNGGMSEAEVDICFAQSGIASKLAETKPCYNPRYAMTNIFWIAANIIFELETGKTTRVLTLVNRVDDASVFPTVEEAQQYLNFVQARAQTIAWSIVPRRPNGFLIRGAQVTP